MGRSAGGAAAAEEAQRDEKRRRVRRRTKRVVGRDWCPWSELLEYVFREDGLRRTARGRTVAHRSREASAIVAGLQRSARGPPGGGGQPGP